MNLPRICIVKNGEWKGGRDVFMEFEVKFLWDFRNFGDKFEKKNLIHEGLLMVDVTSVSKIKNHDQTHLD